MKKARRKNKKAVSGMVLVLTLWVLAILSLLLLTLFTSTNLNTKLAVAAKEDAGRKSIGNGAIYAVLRDLIEQHRKNEKKKKPRESSGSKESTYFMEGKELGFYVVDPTGWKVSKYGEDSRFADTNWLSKNYAVCYVTAEDAKARLNGMKKENLEKLPGVTETVADAIEKLMKKKENKLSCIEELLTIREIRGDIYDGDGEKNAGLKNCLTVFSGGQLYINRATAPAIAAALKIELSQAAKLAEAVKSKHYFYDMDAVASAAGADASKLSGTIGLTCQTYRIKACVISGGRPETVEAVITLQKGNKFSISYMGSI